MRKILTLLAVVIAVTVAITETVHHLGAASNQIVISQVYGGGGNSGAVYKNDFIELFNRSASDVDVTGWTVQYTSAAGTTWSSTTLSGTIQAGHYYLVQEAAGTAGTTSLPTPDATGSIAMSATNAKVALVNTATALSGACPTGASIADLVGYGTGSSAPSCFETAPAPTLTNTTADSRASGGCTDSDNNGADFTSGAANPRNSSSIHSCGSPSGTGSATPNSLTAGNSTLLKVTVTPGTNPASTGLTVTTDLRGIGGSATQPLFDDGTHGDVTGGDNIFSFQATVSGATSAGAKSLPVTITDSQSRTGGTSIALTVTPVSAPPAGAGAASPNTLQPAHDTLLTVTVTPGTGPTSSGLLVVGDLSTIGGSASQQFYDDGTHGDLVAFNNVFSFQATIPAGTVAGAKSLPIAISDAQSRTGSTTIALAVQPPPPPGAGKVMINEIDADTPGSDTAEFIELYDGGSGNTPLDGLVVVLYDGGTDGSGKLSYAAFDLGGYATDPNGYFVLGNPGVPNASPIPFLPGQFGLLQNGPDAVALYVGHASDFPNGTVLTTANLLDAIVYGTDDFSASGLLPLLNAGQKIVNEDATGNSQTQSSQRCPAGMGGFRNTSQ
ncbi:MAG TPA: lamin tail domain-containing protein, partial [Vicinamibacterales bacterium]|nr:lamin tail domain-containing protein [Vicinamibacterales bacterium]